MSELNLSRLDRRTFLKGSMAATAAAAAGSLLAACAPQAPANNSATALGDGAAASAGSPVASGYANPDGIGIPVTPDTTEEADVVVIGSGMGGLTAAMLTKEQAPDRKSVV